MAFGQAYRHLRRYDLPETFERLLGDAKVNLVCTDAPYFVELKNKSGTIANDDLNDKQAYEFLMKCFTNFKNAMAKDASIYEFYATMKTRVFYDAFEDAGFKVGAGLVWKKPRAPLMRTDWKFNMEPIIWGWRKDGKHIWVRAIRNRPACSSLMGSGTLRKKASATLPQSPCR